MNTKNIGGEIHQHEWINFGYNRTKLMELSKNKGDYLLLIDADYVMKIVDIYFKKKLTHDAYNLRWVYGNCDYRNTLLIKGNLDWKYKLPTHEYIYCTSKTIYPVNTDMLGIIELCDGDNRLYKFRKDIDMLFHHIMKFPNDTDLPRCHFYLAMTFENIGDYKLAIKHYNATIKINKSPEEIYFSKYKIGHCKVLLNLDFNDFVGDLLEAYEYRPTRLESIYELIKYCRKYELFYIGYLVGNKFCNEIKYPIDDILFIERNVYEYALKDELSICAYYAKDYITAIKLSNELLKTDNIPKYILDRIKSNMKFSIDEITK
jgi:tetratricopeptide (TPR) repeat protein